MTALRALVDAQWFRRAVLALILINAATLGLESFPEVMAEHGTLLKAVDRAILWVFVAEILLRIAAHGARFFRDPWSLFDFAVVAVALPPSNEAFGVLRAVRVLRVMRLISFFPRLRRVVEGLGSALPGVAAVGAILAILYYAFAVMATKLYGADFPEWFGSLDRSFFSLFQIMTLEGWPDMAREIMATRPSAWLFFAAYILAATFTVLNLFIAVIVDAMQRQHEDVNAGEQAAILRIEGELARLHARIDALGRRDEAERAQRAGDLTR